MDFDCQIRLLLLGDGGAGKSSLLVRYADDRWDDSLQSTVGVDFKLKSMTLLWQRVRLQLWDTNGQERFRSITRAYYRGAQGVALVYDVTDALSFRNISRWVTDIRQHTAGEEIVVTICANKMDLAAKRVVSKQMGVGLAEECNCEYFETSAKTGSGVDEAFSSMAEHIMCGGSRQHRRRVLRSRQRLLLARAAALGVGKLPPVVIAQLAALLPSPLGCGQTTSALDAVLLRQEQQRYEKPQLRRTKSAVQRRVAVSGTRGVSLVQRSQVQPDELGVCW
jgi:small GTP-binding protein